MTRIENPLRRLFLLPALALVAPLLVASPASAATVDTFTIAGSADDAEATAGATLSVAWDVTPVDPAATLVVAPAGSAVGVVDGWNAAAVSAAAGSTVDVTIPADAEPGDDYTFQIIASEDNVPTASDVITVSVVEVVTIVTPAPVVVDGCEFVVPEVTGVLYEAVVAYDDEDGGYEVAEEIEPGRYPSLLFVSEPEEELLVAAYPADGFDFPAGAVTEFPVPVSADCFPTYVETEAVCQGITITNIAGVTIDVIYGDIEGDDAEGGFSLAPAGTRTVSTEGELVIVFAGVELDLDEAAADDLIQVEVVEVDQSCTPAGSAPVAQPSHPTVAPAAGL